MANILDIKSWWDLGYGGAVGYHAHQTNGKESERLLTIDPFGNTTPVWECKASGDSRSSDGGWDTDVFPIDNTKKYRFSVWARTIKGGEGSFYLGLNRDHGTGGVYRRDSGGYNGNPYFHIAQHGSLSTDWVLVVGHVWPKGAGAGSDDPDSGVYTPEGKVSDLNKTDFYWGDNTIANHRSYLYYDNTGKHIQQMVYPRVDVCDGSEPSIDDLLRGFDATEDGLILKHTYDDITPPIHNLLPSELRNGIGESGWHLSQHSGIVTTFVENVYGYKNLIRIKFNDPTSQNKTTGDWYSSVNLGPVKKGEVYIYSYDFRVISGDSEPNLPVIYQNGWNNGGEADKVFLGDEWLDNGFRRRHYQFTINADGDNARLRMSTGYKEKGEIYLLGRLQVTRSHTPLPFCDGAQDGEIVDGSGMDHHVKLPWAKSPVVTKDGLLFDGVKDRLPFYFNPPKYITVMAKVKIMSDKKGYVHILSRLSSQHTLAFKSAVHKKSIYVHNQGNNVVVKSNVINTHRWLWLVYVVEPGKARVYCDDKQVAESAFNGLSAVADEYVVNGGNSGAEYYPVEMQTLLVYNRGLSQREITNIVKGNVVVTKDTITTSKGFVTNKDGVEIVTKSLGYDTKSGAGGIWVGGEQVAKMARDTSIVVISQKGEVLQTVCLDTCGGKRAWYNQDPMVSYNNREEQTTAFIEWTKTLNDGEYLTIATWDEPSQLGRNLIYRDWLTSLGATQHIGLDYRGAYGLIVQLGVGVLQEGYSERYADVPLECHATITSRVAIGGVIQTDVLSTESNEVLTGKVTQAKFLKTRL